MSRSTIGGKLMYDTEMEKLTKGMVLRVEDHDVEDFDDSSEYSEGKEYNDN